MGNEVNFFEERSSLKKEDTPSRNSKLMLNCKSFGFDCNFTTSEEELEKIIEEFQEHTSSEHFTDFPAGILKSSLM